MTSESDSDSENVGRAEFYTDGGEDVPLYIAGHEDRDRPDESDDDGEESNVGDAVLEFSEDDTLEDETDDDEVEPVELLVQLAKDDEIDPWDIDIVHVTDRFLEALDEADLRTSGRALFYASVLLRMKSDELFASDDGDEEEELPPWEAPFADDGSTESDDPAAFDPVENLEAEMERRLERKHARGKPETLDELVRDLRSAERDSRWKESRSYDTSDSPSGYNRGVQELSYHAEDDVRAGDEPSSDDVTHTTHEEDIETVIDDVEQTLERQYEKGRDEVLYAEIDQVGGSRVMTYLALLFLAHRGRVTLEQDELFGDLWVQWAPLEAETEEPLAD
ncbi:chromosome segregation and condensation protein ScpA [Natronobacterium gregoryi SP2]|uniref:Chromosome segregation and condensation protein ScpA n=1 Tax=Natronobacterium gregoryi (strain ATCC 43098 / DSM 3393 / CCM 3738 / CIP 104747 / IAM 13177 / JCM 8860 / NBRC 102187 / NCIMB 2189 / SP2) TaxID=797304 RepID=L9XPY8_NATGS|nr:chromosome segregation and condensation protein ScpA [Natronobacterium gregoryi SP2]